MSVYARSGMLPSETASQISMRSFADWGCLAHSEKSSLSRPRLTSLDKNHDTGATRPYHGQFVCLEWQSWHERSRIAPTCGSITCARRIPLTGTGLRFTAVGTNCIPINANPIRTAIRLNTRCIVLPRQDSLHDPSHRLLQPAEAVVGRCPNRQGLVIKTTQLARRLLAVPLRTNQKWPYM
jgi:hypothetical protein